MKITIDTNTKTVKVEEAINVESLVTELRSMLGDKMNEYTLMPTDIKWINNPVTISPTWVYPTYPSWQPTVICAAGTRDCSGSFSTILYD